MNHNRVCLALILGASEFPELLPGQPPSEAFRNSAAEIEQYFKSQTTGLAAYHVESLFDADLSVIELGNKIEAILRDNSDATDLILYYVGHGGFLNGREYYLALRSTQRTLDHLTGLRMSSLSAIINRSFADRRLFILLDCCFAGTAVNEWQSISSLGTFIEKHTLQTLPPHGTALLVASSKDDPAITPHGRPYTMFFECLRDVLHQGIKDIGPTMSLDDVGERLRFVVNSRFGDYGSIPEIHSPSQRVGDIAKWPLFRNPAYAAPSLPDDLIVPLGNPLPKVRAGAVDTLEDYLATADQDICALALQELKRLAHSDDSTLVRNHAAEALARALGPGYSHDETGSAEATGPAEAAEGAGRANDHSAAARLADPPAEVRDEHDWAMAALAEPAEESRPTPSRHEAPETATGESQAGELEAETTETVGIQTVSEAAELDVSVWASRRRIPPGSTVSWTCEVKNAGKVAVQAIEVTDAAGTQLHPPFELVPGQERTFKFTKQYGQQGGRMTIAVLGRAGDETLVSAEGSGRVTVQQPGRHRQASPPVPEATHPQRIEQPAVAAPLPSPEDPALKSAVIRRRTAIMPLSQPSGQGPLDVSQFRAALRQVKATARLGQISVNRAIRLIGDGERHFRVATGRLAKTDEWQHRVVNWSAEVAALGTNELVMVKLTPPAPQEIVRSIQQLADEIELATGVRIPTHEFVC